MEPTPRLTSITGVSRALIATVGVPETVAILVSQFGWDTAFNALAGLDGPEGAVGLWYAVGRLCCDSDAAAGEHG